MSYTPNLKTKYSDEIVPALIKEFGYKSIMQVPRLEKIVINQGVGSAVADKKLIEISVNELTAITGQKAVPCYSKKDISNFKLRKGMPIGAKVTLRSDMMYEFLEFLNFFNSLRREVLICTISVPGGVHQELFLALA